MKVMFNSQKILMAVFIVLFVISVSELFYVFYYQPSITKKVPLLTPTPTIFVKLNNLTPTPTVFIKSNYIVGLPFIFDEKLASQSGDQVKKIILEAQKKKRDFISYTNLLKAVMVGNQNCLTEKDCFQLNNTAKEGWKNDIDKDFPMTISGPFVMRLNLLGSKEPSGISLFGRLSKEEGKFWWRGVTNIFFGIGEDGKRLHIDARSGEKDEVFSLYDNVFDQKIEGLYILFDEKGTIFFVTDLSYNKITTINLNKITNNKFLEGLFPDKQFYIGYNIAPLSDLKVYDFSIL